MPGTHGVGGKGCGDVVGLMCRKIKKLNTLTLKVIRRILKWHIRLKLRKGLIIHNQSMYKPFNTCKSFCFATIASAEFILKPQSPFVLYLTTEPPTQVHKCTQRHAYHINIFHLHMEVFTIKIHIKESISLVASWKKNRILEFNINYKKYSFVFYTSSLNKPCRST